LQIRERRFDSDLSLQLEKPRRSLIYEAFSLKLKALRGNSGLYIVQALQRSATARMAKSVDARDLKEVLFREKALINQGFALSLKSYVAHM